VITERETTRGYSCWLPMVLLASAVSLLFLSTIAGPAGAAQATGERVTVYYFHSTVRCETCIFVEGLTDVTLQAEFPEELSNGTLVWRPIDVQLAENSHFVTDFGLRANELVVVREKTGENPSWEKIQEIWELARDPERLSHRLKDTVLRFLGKRETIL